MFGINKDKAIRGRSMIEMLAVVAIIGVIGMGALLWLPDAFQRNRVNTLFTEMARRSLALSTSPVMEKAPLQHMVSIPGVDDNTSHYSFFAARSAQVDADAVPDGRFNLHAAGVTREDCQKWAEMVAASHNLEPYPLAAKFGFLGSGEIEKYIEGGLHLNTFCGLNEDGANPKDVGTLSVAYAIERQGLGAIRFGSTIAPVPIGTPCSPDNVEEDCHLGSCCMREENGQYTCHPDTQVFEGCGYTTGEGQKYNVEGGVCFRDAWRDCAAEGAALAPNGSACLPCPAGKVVKMGECSCSCDESQNLEDDGAGHCQCKDGYYFNNKNKCTWCKPTPYRLAEVLWDSTNKKCACHAENGYHPIKVTIKEVSDCELCPLSPLGGVLFGQTIERALEWKDETCVCKVSGMPAQLVKTQTSEKRYYDLPACRECPAGLIKSKDYNWKTEPYDPSKKDLYCVTCEEDSQCKPGKCIKVNSSGTTIDDNDNQSDPFWMLSGNNGVNIGRSIKISGEDYPVLYLGLSRESGFSSYVSLCNNYEKIVNRSDLWKEKKEELITWLNSMCTETVMIDGETVTKASATHFLDNIGNQKMLMANPYDVSSVSTARQICLACDDEDCICPPPDENMWYVPFLIINESYVRQDCVPVPRPTGELSCSEDSDCFSKEFWNDTFLNADGELEKITDLTYDEWGEYIGCNKSESKHGGCGCFDGARLEWNGNTPVCICDNKNPYLPNLQMGDPKGTYMPNTCDGQNLHWRYDLRKSVHENGTKGHFHCGYTQLEGHEKDNAGLFWTICSQNLYPNKMYANFSYFVSNECDGNAHKLSDCYTYIQTGNIATSKNFRAGKAIVGTELLNMKHAEGICNAVEKTELVTSEADYTAKTNGCKNKAAIRRAIKTGNISENEWIWLDKKDGQYCSVSVGRDPPRLRFHPASSANDPKPECNVEDNGDTYHTLCVVRDYEGCCATEGEDNEDYDGFDDNKPCVLPCNQTGVVNFSPNYPLYEALSWVFGKPVKCSAELKELLDLCKDSNGTAQGNWLNSVSGVASNDIYESVKTALQADRDKVWKVKGTNPICYSYNENLRCLNIDVDDQGNKRFLIKCDTADYVKFKHTYKNPSGGFYTVEHLEKLVDVKAKLMKLVCRKIKVNGVEGAIVHGGQVDNLRKFIKVADNKLAISAEKCDTDAASSCNMAVPFKDESYDFSCKIDGKTIDIPWINENGKTELESVEDFVRKIKNWCGYVYSTSDANCKRELFIESL